MCTVTKNYAYYKFCPIPNWQHLVGGGGHGLASAVQRLGIPGIALDCDLGCNAMIAIH